MRWRGEAGRAVEALEAVGFLKRTGDGFECVDWRQHEGHLELFANRARAAADARWGRKPNATSNAKGECLKHSNKGGASSTPSVPSVPTIPTIPKDIHPEALPLAKKLGDLMRVNDPKAKVPGDLAKWAKDADRLFRLDGREPSEVYQVLAWCQSDGFWRGNILSISKFREKYTALLLKMNAGGQNGTARGPGRIVGDAAPIPGKYSGLEQ